MDPKPQDDEPFELDEELVIEDDEEAGEPDEDALLEEFGL